MQLRVTKKSDVKCTYLVLPYLNSEPICMMGKKSLGLRVSRSQKVFDFQRKLVQTSPDKSNLSKPKVWKKGVCWQTCYLFVTKTLLGTYFPFKQRTASCTSENKLSMSGHFQYLWFFLHRLDINAFVYQLFFFRPFYFIFLSPLKTNWASKIKMG